MAFHTPRMPQGIQITGISIIKKCSDGAKTVAAQLKQPYIKWSITLNISV